ncbi:hypothetical protein [Microbacterium suaedae]|uniref:hypothetical protein n=1 Tax=Microbacterium suaedae TaxID=2067813 RepID=UPI0013A62B3D|nr:hypothetical protein [Microbacterium suaedae]
MALGHAEVVRLREQQAARISSHRARASSIVAAAGIAATIAGTVSINPGYFVPIPAFICAVIYAVKSMLVVPVETTDPEFIVSRAAHASERDARIEILGQLNREYWDHENELDKMAKHVHDSLRWFIAGTSLIGLVALVNVGLVLDS